MAIQLFDFEAEFRLGIDEIDHEHATLVNMLNEVHSLVQAGNKEDARAYFRQTLTGYVVEHFANEELYMENIGFPQIDEHRQIHAKFKQAFLEKLPLIDAYDDAAFRNALADTFAWIINHIGKTDRKYAIFASKAA